MVSSAREKIFRSIAKWLLVAIIVNNIFESNVIVAIAEDTLSNFTFHIVDTEENPIQGASILCTTISGGAISLVSNHDGSAVVDLYGFSESVIQGGITNYSVTKHGYEDVVFSAVSGSALSFMNKEHRVSMTQLPLVTISGKVKTENMSVVSGASITLSGYQDYVTTTDENGDFVFEGVYGTNKEVAKEYTISIINENYMDYSDIISVSNINVTKDITLTEKKTQAPLEFLTTYPEAIDILLNNGVQINNPASGGSGTGAINYEIISQTALKTDHTPLEVANIDSHTGIVTFLQPGTIEVKAVKAGDKQYKKAEALYQLTFNKANIPDFQFETVNPFPINTESSFINKANSSICTELSDIVYSMINGSDVATVDASTGELTILSSGNITVQATKSATTFYNEAITSYDLEIVKANPDDLVFDNPNPGAIYWNDIGFTNKAGSLKGSGKITYFSSDNDIATVDNSGKVTGFRSGTVIITAVKAADLKYAESSSSYSLTLLRVPQDTFRFDDVPSEVVYEDNNNELEVKVTGKLGDAPLTYTTDNSNVAYFINKNSNVLKIVKPGTVKLTVEVAANDYYEEKSISMILTVKRADQTITFAKPYTHYELFYGQTFSNVAKGGKGSGQITYSITQGNDIVAIEPNSGELTFKDNGVGDVTVTAVKEEDEYYNSAQATYTLKVSYLTTPEVPYTIEGTKKNSSQWYTSDIRIVAKAGYLISYSNSIQSSNEWSASLSYKEEGSHTAVIYLKQIYSGGITDAITTETINLDSKAPIELSINYPESLIRRLISGITNIFSNDNNIIIKLSGKDETTAIDKITYTGTTVNGDDVITGTISKDQIIFDDETKTYSTNLEINEEFRGNISFCAIDTAGNEAYYQDGNIMVMDTIAPKVTIKYSEPTILIDSEGNEWDKHTTISGDTIFLYQNKINVEVNVEETNFFEGLSTDYSEMINNIKIIVHHTDLNGSTTDTVYIPNNIGTSDNKSILTWEHTVKDLYKTNLVFEEDGDYIIEIQYQDDAGNPMEFDSEREIKNGALTYCSNVYRIDSTVPEVQIRSSTDISNEDIYVEFNITEHNFNTNCLVIDITAKDINGDLLPIDTEELENSLKNSKNWSKSAQGTWISNLIFSESANYNIRLTYIDQAGNDSGEKSINFTVDKTIPSNLQITYSTPVLERIIDSITFGFYKERVIVTFTSEDYISNAKSFDYMCILDPNASKINIGLQGSINEGILHNNSLSEAKLTVPAQFRGSVAFCITDMAGNKSEYMFDDKIIVVDDISPSRKVMMSPVQIVDNITLETHESYDELSDIILFFSGDAVLNFVVDEANFYPEDIQLSVSKDNGPWTEIHIDSWTRKDSEKDEWTSSATLSGNGEYVVSMVYTDRSGNQMVTYTSNKIVIDMEEPLIDAGITGEKQATVNGIDYYKDTQTLTVRIKEKYFRAKDVIANVTAKRVDGDDVPIDVLDIEEFNKYLQNSVNWTHDGELHTANIMIDADANYAFRFSYIDLALNEVSLNEPYKFTVDNKKPQNLSVIYSTSIIDTIIEAISFGFYNSAVNVKISAEDEIAGIASLSYKFLTEGDSSDDSTSQVHTISNTELSYESGGKVASYTFDISAQYNGSIYFEAIDYSGNLAEFSDNKKVIIDSISPQASITFNMPKGIIDGNNSYITVMNDDAILLYPNDIQIEIKIEEANFFEGKLGENGQYINDVLVKVVREIDGVETETQYVPYDNGGPGKAKLIWESTGTQHKSNITLQEDGDYKIFVAYKDKSGNEMLYNSNRDEKNGIFTYTSNTLRIDKTAPSVNASSKSELSNETIPVTISVQERNFNPEDFNIELHATDIDGNTISKIDTAGYISSIKGHQGWSKEGNNSWKTIVEFSQSAIYTMRISYTDKAGNRSNEHNITFIVDKDAPKQENLEITYSTPVLSKIIDTITFGFYREPVTVTLQAEDEISGIGSFEYHYSLRNGVSKVNKGQDQDTLVNQEDILYGSTKRNGTTSFKISPEMVGNVFFTASDIAGNRCEGTIDPTVLVVDSISPTREIKLSPVHIVDKTTLETKTYSEEDSNSKLFFSGDATLFLTINEANFYPEDVVIKVSKNSEAYTTVIPDIWKQSEDNWSSSITLSGDGDYIVTISYMDRSGNLMSTYTSDVIVIDTKKPVVAVRMDQEAQNNLEGILYYNSVQTATITVSEHNFRPEDITVEITASKVDGSTVAIEDYNAYLRNIKNWSKKGDVYTANLKFSKDANYMFDISYKDLAFNEADRIKPLYFTVDTKEPATQDIHYDTAILDTVIQTVSFSFYNGKTTVKISAEDDTSGVEYFTYSYIKKDGALGSSVVDQKIPRDKITYTENGSKAEASFTIPTASVDEHGQFRGTVSYKVYDRSGNSKEYTDSKIVVVDTISPALSVSYNEPFVKDGQVAYYPGDVLITFHMKEENFYEEDMVVSLIKDQGAPILVKPTWMKNGDEWTGTYTIAAADDHSHDGEYYITVDYADKSSNSMTTYKSDKIIVDTTKPLITIRGIKDKSANKAEVIGFEIEVKDTNLKGFKPELYVTKMDESKKLYDEKIDTGTIMTINVGETYLYRVENLLDDGVYSIKCNAEDYAGNTSDSINDVDDSMNDNKNNIIFSVNRNGSTFTLGNKTASIINSYYIKEIDSDIEIIEVNVDPLKGYGVLINDAMLEENTDYIVEEDNNLNGWYSYRYILNKDLFSEEGEYSVVIRSEDKVGTISFSDIKKAEISFVIDHTMPEMVVSGMESYGRYRAEAKAATVLPRDPGGELHKLSITINSTDNILYLENDDLIQTLYENGRVSFDIPSGMNQNIQIRCIDKAGNENYLDFRDITISTEWYILFYANKPLFWGSLIGAFSTLVGVFTFIQIRRLKRKRY